MRVPEVVREVARVLDRRAVSWERPECGLSAAHRYAVRLDDGSEVFVKGAADEQTAQDLRVEHATLRTVGGDLGPAIRHWLPGHRPILITEHLADYWPSGTGRTVWRPGDVEAVLASLSELRMRPPPAEMPLAPWPEPTWSQLLGDHELVAAGLCSSAWMGRYGDQLVEADEHARSRADCVVHGDVRSDNLCLAPGGRARFVDWSNSGAGHQWHDLITFLPTVRLEGGPDPASVFDRDARAVVRLAGPCVQRAVHFSGGPDWLGRVLLELARINLDWIATLLDLEPPPREPVATPRR